MAFQGDAFQNDAFQTDGGGAQSVTLGLINQAAIASAPVVGLSQTVTVGLLSQPADAFAPDVSIAYISPELLSQTAAVFAPVVAITSMPALPYIVQSGQISQIPNGGNLVLPALPTLGNVLLAFVTADTDAGPAFTLSNGTWTLAVQVYSGFGTNWPHRVYYQKVESALSNTTSITAATGGGSIRACIVEVGNGDVPTGLVTAGTSNTGTTTVGITPTATRDSILFSSVFSRGGLGLNPVTGMTEHTEIGTTRPLGVNYRVVTAASGSYTVGSTGAGGNSSVAALALLMPLGIVARIDQQAVPYAPLLTYNQFLTVGLISVPPTALAPTVTSPKARLSTLSVEVAILPSDGNLRMSTLSAEVAVVPGTAERAVRLSTLSVEVAVKYSQEATPGLISQTAVAYAPVVTAPFPGGDQVIWIM